MVVLNTIDIITDLLEKNSAVTSDRPAHHFSTVIEGIDNNITL
jgi:hypothetical protein